MPGWHCGSRKVVAAVPWFSELATMSVSGSRHLARLHICWLCAIIVRSIQLQACRKYAQDPTTFLRGSKHLNINHLNPPRKKQFKMNSLQLPATPCNSLQWPVAPHRRTQTRGYSPCFRERRRVPWKFFRFWKIPLQALVS